MPVYWILTLLFLFRSSPIPIPSLPTLLIHFPVTLFPSSSYSSFSSSLLFKLSSHTFFSLPFLPPTSLSLPILSHCHRFPLNSLHTPPFAFLPFRLLFFLIQYFLIFIPSPHVVSFLFFLFPCLSFGSLPLHTIVRLMVGLTEAAHNLPKHFYHFVYSG